jgi:hypothetical protein
MADDRINAVLEEVESLRIFWRPRPRVLRQPFVVARVGGPGRPNTVTVDPIASRKVRAVFTHAGQSRSGLTEIEIREN